MQPQPCFPNLGPPDVPQKLSSPQTRHLNTQRPSAQSQTFARRQIYGSCFEMPPMTPLSSSPFDRARRMLPSTSNNVFAACCSSVAPLPETSDSAKRGELTIFNRKSYATWSTTSGDNCGSCLAYP